MSRSADVPATLDPCLRPAWRAADPASESQRWSDPLGRATTQRRLTTAGGDYWICAETGHFTADAPPADAEDHYESYWGQRSQDVAMTPTEAKRRAAFVAQFEPHRKLGRLLEVGCGLGWNLRAAADAGWEAIGNELDTFAADQARQYSGATVHPGTIERVELEPGSLDVVIADNVFEHLEQPGAFVEQVSRWLRPGGVLFVQTLHVACYAVRDRPTQWGYFHAGHVHIPTRRSMELYAERGGLAIAHWETHGYTSADHATPRKRGPIRKHHDKLMSALGGLRDRGHRLKCLLRKLDA